MQSTRRILISIGLIAAVVALCAWIVFGGDRTEKLGNTSFDFRTKQGLDLQGGYQILLQARSTSVTSEQMNAARRIIENRVNGLGTNEPLITVQGDNRISVELPGVTDEEQVRKAIGSTGRLEFIEAGDTVLNEGDAVQTSYCTTGSLFQKQPGLCGASNSTGNAGATTVTAGAGISASGTPGINTAPALTPGTTAPASTAEAAAAATSPVATGTPGATTSPAATPTAPGKTNAQGQPFQTVITGEQLDPTKVDRGFAETGGAEKVLFGVKADASQLFGTFTGSNLGKQMAIVLDGKVISSARINGVISTQGEISSSTWATPKGKQEVAGIVTQLRYGALPVELDVLSSRKVGATLGSDSVDKSILAGAIGLGIVAAFMILYFRVPGIISVLALLIYTLISFAVYKWFGVVLTLAGIAGFILSIGMAVDANVLIFARLKEEMRLGRSIERSVEESFRNAWPSIRDSNISTLITCLILYWFGDFTGTSSIKGFSLTLALGVLVSMFSAIIVTQTLMRLMFVVVGGQRKLTSGAWWFGMNRTRRAVDEAAQAS